MKLLRILMFVIAATPLGNVHAGPADGPLWVDLPQPNGSVFYCDLMAATQISFYGDQVIAQNSVSPAQGLMQSVVYLQEKSHETALKVLKALQAAPERWLETTDPAAAERLFLKVGAINTVTFGSDKDGDFARVTLRNESVAIATAGPDGKIGLYEKLDSGHEVRGSASIQRLKNIVALH